jgi:DNA-binding transcriptional ArsR family regulator
MSASVRRFNLEGVFDEGQARPDFVSKAGFVLAVSDLALIILAATDGSFAQDGMSPHLNRDNSRTGSPRILTNHWDRLGGDHVVAWIPIFHFRDAIEVLLNGICLRNHCGAEPPRDTESPDLVPAVGGRDRGQLRMSQPTVSKHLRVLREAGFVESTVDAPRRFYRLKPEPFEELDAWLARFRRFWSAHVDALERHLNRIDSVHPTGAPFTLGIRTRR